MDQPSQTGAQSAKVQISKVVALAGGVGGAKLSSGMQAVLPPGSLTVVVNTGDDFRLWGLQISPDIDTVMYTLAGIANPATGWGQAGETWNSLNMIQRYGRDVWFRVGDKDLATDVLRTHMLSEGRTLTDVTQEFCAKLGVPSQILPMCNEPVQTLIETPEDTLDFQDYFVRRKHADVVAGVTFRGAEHAKMTSLVRQALEAAEAIVFCPSNPIVSIGPILAVAGVQGAIEKTKAPRVAVSPIVGGTAVKGPAGDMLRSLGHEVSPVGVAALYAGLLDGIVIDKTDEQLVPRIKELGMEVHVADTIMNTNEDRARLAEEVLQFCLHLC